MANNDAICEICDIHHIKKPSISCCSECDEEPCLQCNKSDGISIATRNHNIVPISKYETLPRNILHVSHLCCDHNEKFQIYCKKHDRPCCRKCVVFDHQTCQDLIRLDDMAQNVKNSYGFYCIEQTIVDLVDNIQRIKNDRQANLSTLKEEREIIEKEIEKTRIQIIIQLDKLQENLIKELYEAESKESMMIGQLLDAIEKNEMEIRQHQQNLIHIKQNASDLQTFLAMKQIERNVSEINDFFTFLVKCDKLNQVSLSFKMNDALQNIMHNIYQVQTFGDVIINTCSSELEILRKKENQAQIVINPVPSKSIDKPSFILQTTIDTKLDNISGCSLLLDGRIVFSCYKQERIRGFNRDGSQDFDISLKPDFAFDITYIRENNVIAVTSGGAVNQYIKIIDIERESIKEIVHVESDNYGIASRNNTLIYCAGDCGLKMLNLTDQSNNNIITTTMSVLAYVASFGDQLYYTNADKHTVTCCDLHGTIQWTFQDKSVLLYPQGISVDNSGNVYVACKRSNNVVVISPDGQQHKQLFSKKDDLYLPQVLHFDRSTNQLLVANRKGKAFLYKYK